MNLVQRWLDSQIVIISMVERFEVDDTNCYSLSNYPIPSTLAVYINGIALSRNHDYIYDQCTHSFKFIRQFEKGDFFIVYYIRQMYNKKTVKKVI
jgi:hypothetical protein